MVFLCLCAHILLYLEAVVVVCTQHVMAAALQRLVDNGAALRASVDLTGVSVHHRTVEAIGRTLCHKQGSCSPGRCSGSALSIKRLLPCR